jgi:manganese/zinc/iron transport system substrate-binding protein
MRLLFTKLSIVFGAWVILGCSAKETVENQTIKVVATTGMLGDALEQLLSGQAEVITLMKPGVDPHLFKATQSDLKKLQEADIIVYNGYFLEGKLGDVLSRLQRTKTIIAAAELLPADKILTAEDQAEDPHIWMDPVLWADMLELLSDHLGSGNSFDAEILRKNANEYIKEVRELDAYAKSKMDQIPAEQKILITAHDAFGYFGRRYSMEVRGLQGISTLSEFGLRDVSNLVDYIVSQKVPAIYVESSVSDRSIKAVVEGCKAKGHDVRIGGTLYSDALGDTGTEEGRYVGMFIHNVDQIFRGLSSSTPSDHE